MDTNEQNKMISPDEFLDKFEDVFTIIELNENEYPETYEAAQDWKFRFEDKRVNFKRIQACTGVFIDNDKTLQMLPAVAELVEGVLLYYAGRDDAEAANTLGNLYYIGRLGKKDFQLAKKYYEIAARLGSMNACENLGYIYYYGRVGEPDYEKSFKYFIKGSLNNRPISSYKIGDFYRNGYYVEKDPEQAFRIYKNCKKSLDKDDEILSAGADVSLRIGDCYFEGIGTEQDYKNALINYSTAENLYYVRIENGEYFYMDNLKRAIINQQICRQKLLLDLPGYDWVKEMPSGT